MNRANTLGVALWFLLTTTLTWGFYVGDTASSHTDIEQWAGDELDTVAEKDGTATVAAARTVASVGIGGAESVAHWTHRHDGTLLGDGVEAIGLFGVWLPAGALAYRDLVRVVRA